MKYFVFLIVFCVTIPCYAGARIQRNIIHDRYSQDIFRIAEYENSPSHTDMATNITRYTSRLTQMEFIELKNGLFGRLTFQNLEWLSGNNNDSTKLEYGNQNAEWSVHHSIEIGFNIYHNLRSDSSEIRLIHLMAISEHEIYHMNNRTEIIGIRSVEAREEESGYPIFFRERIKIVFEYNTFGRINGYKIFNHSNNVLLEEYIFIYNGEGKLEGIYSVHDWGNVLRKSIYYDGQLRFLERPFFEDINKINLDEIVVLDNGRIKYHSKRYRHYGVGSTKPILSEDFLTNEMYHYSYIIEFNEQGDQIRQIDILRDNRTETNIEYIQFDNRGNWVLMRIGRNGYKREIVYR